MLNTSLPFENVVFIFTAYYVIERGLRRFSRSKNPVFHEYLLRTRKDLPYFGITMGLLITLFSTPTCGYAAYTAIYPWKNVKIEAPESVLGMTSTAGTICMVSRGVLWVSELNRLGEHDFYLYHHLLSLIHLITTLAIKIPLGVIYAIYSGLVSEITGDLVWLCGAHGFNAENSALFRRLQALNIAQYAVVRAPGIIFGFYFLVNIDIRTSSRINLAFQLMVYTIFVLYCTISNAAKIGWIKIMSEQPAHLRVGNHIFTAYGLYMGLGFASLVAGAVVLYADPSESAQVSTAICRVLLCAVLGARTLSLIFEDGLAKLLSDPLAAIFRPGFWLHGGILGAAAGILFSRNSILRPLDMMAALGVTLPLYEAFSRIGCSSYGCCFGRALSPSEITGSSRPLLWRLLPAPAVTYHSFSAAAVRQRAELRGRPLFPIQVISAVLFAIQFIGVITLLLTGCLSVGSAGWASVILHAGIRMVTERFRDDFRGDVSGRCGTVTGLLAGFQMVVGLGIAVAKNRQAGSSKERMAGFGWDRIVDENVAYCAFFAFALGVTVYGYNFRRIGTWLDRKEVKNFS